MTHVEATSLDDPRRTLPCLTISVAQSLLFAGAACHRSLTTGLVHRSVAFLAMRAGTR